MGFAGFGYLGAPANTDPLIVAYNAILAGSSYKEILARNIKYAVSFLQSLKEVDPKRIGITGLSFGGDMAITYAALTFVASLPHSGKEAQS